MERERQIIIDASYDTVPFSVTVGPSPKGGSPKGGGAAPARPPLNPPLLMSSLLRIRHHVGDYPAGITSTMMEAAEMWMNWITTGPTSGLKIQDCNFQSYSFLCHFPAFCFHLSKCYWSFHLLFSVVYGWKCIFHFVVCSVVSGPLLPPTEVFLVLRLLIPVLYGVKETQDWKTTDPEARLIFQPAGRGAMENEGLEDDGLTSRVAVGLARCVSLILR